MGRWHQRGLSAIIVVLCHIAVTIDGVGILSSYRPLVLHNFWDGNFAVHVFIILSTILTCHGIAQHRAELITRYRYLVLKRYFRLLIPVGTIIMMMYIANLIGLFYAEEYGTKTGNQWLTGITETLIHLPGTILFAPLGGGYTVLRVAWMLRYVCLGTMWVIILDLLLSERQPKSQIILLLLCTYIAWKIDFYYVNVIVGYTLYLYKDNILSSHLYIKLLQAVIILFLFILSDMYVQNEQGNMLRAIVVVSMVIIIKPVQSAFSWYPAVWLGKISMNIYLLQLLVIYSITCRMANSLPRSILYNSLMYVVTLSTIIIIAFLFTKYIEPTLNKITDRLLVHLN